MLQLLSLIYACERLLLVAVAAMCIWLGWRLVCPPNGVTPLLSGWQRLGRAAVSIAFALLLMVFGGWMLFTIEGREAVPIAPQAATVG